MNLLKKSIFATLVLSSVVWATDPFEQANKDKTVGLTGAAVLVKTNEVTKEQELLLPEGVKTTEAKSAASKDKAGQEKFMTENLIATEKAKLLGSTLAKDQDNSTPAGYRSYFGGGWYGWGSSYRYYSSIIWYGGYYYSSYYYYSWSYYSRGYYYDWYFG